MAGSELFASRNRIRNRLLASAAGAASGGHLFSRTPSAAAATIASPASDPGATGLTNLGPQNGFMSATTATITAGSADIVVASNSGMAVGQPIVDTGSNSAKPVYIPLGATILAINGTTVTMSKQALASGSGIAVRTIHEGLKFTGAIASQFGTNVMAVSKSTGPAGASKGTPAVCILEMITDAALFSTAATGLQFRFYNNGKASPKYRVAIDGVYQTDDPVAFANAGASVSNWLTIQLAAAGSRHVRVEFDGALVLTGVWVRTGATLWRPPERPVLGFYGDSWMSGGSANSWPGRNPPTQIAEILGCEPMYMGQGGTGYTNNGAGNANMSYEDPIRLNDLLLKPLDALVIFGSVNDGTTNSTADALLTYQRARALYPKMPIHIFGVPTTGVYSAANATLQEGYHAAAFASFADLDSWYHPITTNPSGALFNANNLATYIDSSSDNNHLTDVAGSNFLSRWMAAAIHQDWIGWDV